MSLGILQLDEKIRIAAERATEFLVALCRHFYDLPSSSLKEALDYLEVTFRTDEHGNIVDLCLETCRLTYHPDELVACLAPYVDSGSYLIMCLEDGEAFMYGFRDGEWYEEGVGVLDHGTGELRGYGEDYDDGGGEEGERMARPIRLWNSTRLPSRPDQLIALRKPQYEPDDDDQDDCMSRADHAGDVPDGTGDPR